MVDDAPDMRHLPEAEWLETLRDMLSALELTRAELEQSGDMLTAPQAAYLAGQADMLRRILESRGVNLGADR